MRWHVVLVLLAAGFSAGNAAASVALPSARQSQGGASADSLYQSVVDAIKKYDTPARLGTIPSV
jgi:hypothetical protein